MAMGSQVEINRLDDGQVGRFGWKADVPSLIAQTTGAFVHDMGITSTLEPNHPHTDAQAELDELPNGGLPEVDDKKVPSASWAIWSALRCPVA